MDLNSILPLLLSSNGAQTADIIKAILGNKEYSGVETVMELMKDRQKNKTNGFAPVLDFVSDDILGVLTRFFA